MSYISLNERGVVGGRVLRRRRSATRGAVNGEDSVRSAAVVEHAEECLVSIASITVVVVWSRRGRAWRARARGRNRRLVVLRMVAGHAGAPRNQRA